MNTVQQLLMQRIVQNFLVMLEKELGGNYDADRLTCPHATYLLREDPIITVCRCVICGRCNEHTGNSSQGHYWAFCKVTGTFRSMHFCCPGHCQLEEER